MYALGDFGSFHAGGRIVTVYGKEKRIVRFTADTDAISIAQVLSTVVRRWIVG